MLVASLVLSLQQLRVDVGDQLEIDPRIRLLVGSLHHKKRRSRRSPYKVRQGDAETQEAKLMNASGQLLSELSKERLLRNKTTRKTKITNINPKRSLTRLCPVIRDGTKS